MDNSIYPCLWFDDKAKEAAMFYTTIFPDTRITSENAIVVELEASGQKFMCLNGINEITINPSISFMVLFEDKNELKAVWDKLAKEGQVLMPLDRYGWSEQYGWLQDKFGVSWQLIFGEMAGVGQKFTPTILYANAQAGKAEEAIRFYTSLFPDSSIQGIMKYEAGEGDVEGHVKHAQFRIKNYVIAAMDSAIPHQFNFNDGVSILVECDDQAEIDRYWNALTANGGKESMCGWLKDPYGVSWQIIPSVLKKLMSDPDRSQRVVQAFLKMKKFNIAALLEA